MQNKTRWIFLVFIVASLNNHIKAQSKKDNRPNILLIVADDLGYTDLGCYGGDIKTPNIDLLAKRGLLFNNFHTAPLCAPTRSMILSAIAGVPIKCHAVVVCCA